MGLSVTGTWDVSARLPRTAQGQTAVRKTQRASTTELRSETKHASDPASHCIQVNRLNKQTSFTNRSAAQARIPSSVFRARGVHLQYSTSSRHGPNSGGRFDGNSTRDVSCPFPWSPCVFPSYRTAAYYPILSLKSIPVITVFVLFSPPHITKETLLGCVSVMATQFIGYSFPTSPRSILELLLRDFYMAFT